MTRKDIINRVNKAVGAKTYLEIGVQTGKNFLKINAPAKVAVDPQFKIKRKRKIWYFRSYRKASFFEMTSDDFFEKQGPEVFKNRPLDVAFIDGLHTYEQSYKDFVNCLKHLAPNGVIMLHDCNPESLEASAPAYSPKDMKEKYPTKPTYEWNGDVWKTIVRIRSLHPDLEVFTLNCDYGVGVVRRGTPQDMLAFSLGQIDELQYADLESNRNKFLNLKEPGYLESFVATV